MKVLFVGDEPSKFNKDPSVAFVGAKCYSRVLEWCSYLKLKSPEFLNSNSEYLLSEIKKKYQAGYKIICLGKKAQKRLDMYDIPYIFLPHPSGLNRQINDKVFIKKQLDECFKSLNND